MRNGWTGGQYSLLRFGLGLWLAWRFFDLGATTGPLAAELRWPLAGLGLLSAIALALGLRDRAGALVAAACLLSLAGRAELGIAWQLLAHAWIRQAPYGSLAAAGRDDPGGGWRLPERIYAATWGVIGVLFVWTVLADAAPHPIVAGLRLAWLPLGLFRPTRPWIWTLALASQAGSAAALPAPQELDLLVVLLFAFDPGWIRPAQPGLRDLVFFDGNCGLCHRAVRFLLAEDGTAARFSFAPLDGETFRDRLSDAERNGLPDSLVLRAPGGLLATRSAAVLRAMRRLGGIWRALAAVVGLLPRRLLDAAYDGVARGRRTVFATPAASCPRLADRLRDRMLP